MADAQMQFIGELDGKRLHFADARFAEPGIYYWDGTTNVRVWPTQPPHHDRGEDARASFERWVRSYHEHPEQAPLSYTNGCYDDEETQYKWVGYAAALTEAKQQDDDGWEANFRYLLDRSPHTLRSREGGGPENLLQSAILTFTRMEQLLAAKQQGPGEAVYQSRDAYGAWRDTTKSHYDIETQHDKRTLYTAPQVEAKRQTGEGVVLTELLKGWVRDGDTIPADIIKRCREAIRREFGNNGTDGYYKRILVKVFLALIAAAAKPSGGG